MIQKQLDIVFSSTEIQRIERTYGIKVEIENGCLVLNDPDGKSYRGYGLNLLSHIKNINDKLYTISYGCDGFEWEGGKPNPSHIYMGIYDLATHEDILITETGNTDFEETKNEFKSLGLDVDDYKWAYVNESGCDYLRLVPKEEKGEIE